MKNSYLITGGTGLIGSRLVKALDKTRYKIYILSRRDQLDRDGIHFIKWNPEKSLLNISKIIICTYPETSFSEAMISNRPTILIYKKNHYQFPKKFMIRK